MVDCVHAPHCASYPSKCQFCGNNLVGNEDYFKPRLPKKPPFPPPTIWYMDDGKHIMFEIRQP